jgi:hypothetical protein
MLISTDSLRQSTLRVCCSRVPLNVSICTNVTFPAEGSGSGSWASAYQKAREFVGKLTPEEKVNLTAGISAKNGCSGNIGPVDHLGFPGFCVSDAGNGLVSTNSFT